MAQYGLIPDDISAVLARQNIEAATGSFGDTFQPRLDIDFHVIAQEGLVEAVIGRIERESHQFGILLLFSGDTGLGGFRRKLAQCAVHAVLHVYRRHVRVTYPGANAETVQKAVITPLEEAINGVEDMTYMTSRRCDVGVLFHRQGKHGNHAQQYNHHRDNARKHRAIIAYRLKNGQAEAAYLTVDRLNDGNRFIVKEGLSVGDTIVAEGVGLVREGMSIPLKRTK